MSELQTFLPSSPNPIYPQIGLDGDSFTPMPSHGWKGLQSDVLLQQVNQQQIPVPLTLTLDAAPVLTTGGIVAPVGDGSMPIAPTLDDALIGSVSTLLQPPERDFAKPHSSDRLPNLEVVKSSAIALAIVQLQNFESDPAFASKLQTAFGSGGDRVVT